MPLAVLSVLTHSSSEHQEYLCSCEVWKSNAHHLMLESLGELIDRFSFPGSGAGKRHQVLTGEKTGL